MSIARFDLLTLNIERIYRSVETPLVLSLRTLTINPWRQVYEHHVAKIQFKRKGLIGQILIDTVGSKPACEGISRLNSSVEAPHRRSALAQGANE